MCIRDRSLDDQMETLEFLFEHTEKKDFIYEHQWSLGDFVMWDNRCVNHARKNFPSTQRRLLRRNVIQGTQPKRANIWVHYRCFDRLDRTEHEKIHNHPGSNFYNLLGCTPLSWPAGYPTEDRSRLENFLICQSNREKLFQPTFYYFPHSSVVLGKHEMIGLGKKM